MADEQGVISKEEGGASAEGGGRDVWPPYHPTRSLGRVRVHASRFTLWFRICGSGFRIHGPSFRFTVHASRFVLTWSREQGASAEGVGGPGSAGAGMHPLSAYAPPTGCPVLMLRISYAMTGTDIVYLLRNVRY
eukprot:2126257-Rhodomonas_salina.5